MLTWGFWNVWRAWVVERNPWPSGAYPHDTGAPVNFLQLNFCNWTFLLAELILRSYAINMVANKCGVMIGKTFNFRCWIRIFFRNFKKFCPPIQANFWSSNPGGIRRFFGKNDDLWQASVNFSGFVTFESILTQNLPKWWEVSTFLAKDCRSLNMQKIY